MCQSHPLQEPIQTCLCCALPNNKHLLPCLCIAIDIVKQLYSYFRDNEFSNSAFKVLAALLPEAHVLDTTCHESTGTTRIEDNVLYFVREGMDY